MPLPSVTSRPPSSTNRWSCASAFPADAARDVVGLRRRAVARRGRRLLVGHRAPGPGQPVDLLGQLQVHVAVEQHVHAVAQRARADVLVADVDVGHAPLVERVAHPADGVGIGPRHPHAEPRGLARDGAGRRGGVRAGEVEARSRGGDAQRRRQSVLRRQHPGAGRVIRRRRRGSARSAISMSKPARRSARPAALPARCPSCRKTGPVSRHLDPAGRGVSVRAASGHGAHRGVGDRVSPLRR